MRQVSIKDFQANLYLQLKDLPIEVTRRGEPLFWVIGESPEHLVEIKSPVSIPQYCEISKANPAIKCIRPPEGKFHILWTGGSDPVEWRVWLCKGHSKVHSDDIKITEI